MDAKQATDLQQRLLAVVRKRKLWMDWRECLDLLNGPRSSLADMNEALTALIRKGDLDLYSDGSHFVVRIAKK